MLAHPVVSLHRPPYSVRWVTLAPSMSSSLASSLAWHTGSGGSSPALPTSRPAPTRSARQQRRRGVPGKPGALLPLCTRLGTFLCTRVGTALSSVGSAFPAVTCHLRAVLPQESAYLAGNAVKPGGRHHREPEASEK